MGNKTKDSYQAWMAEDHLYPSATEVKSQVHSFLTYFMTIYILWADYRTKQMMTEKHITVYSKYPKYNTVHCLTAFILQTL